MSVSTFGDLLGSLTAGQDINASTVGDANVNLTAGRNISLSAQGNATPGLVSAGGNINVLALGSLSAPAVTAGGSVALGSLGSAQVTVIHAGGDASAFSNSDLTATLNASGTASAMAMGNLSATLTAGQDAAAWALGDVHDSSLTAGGQASITALGQATNDTLSGAQGAFVLGRGNVTAITANSSAGDVGVASLADATDLNITAHGNASAAAFGNLNAAHLTATTGEVDTYSVGSTTASVQSAGDANIISFGGLVLTGPENAPAQIGGNLMVTVVGDGLVSANVGHDVSATDYGNLQGTVSAGGNIYQLWTTGDLTGTYTAGAAIGTVTSYGAIDAALTANGGDIYKVAAWNSLGGSLTASGAIGTLYAGGLITAATSAAAVGNLVEHDRSQFTDHPVAPTPQIGETITSANQAMAAAQLLHATLASGASSQQTGAAAAQAALLQGLNYQVGVLTSAQSAVASAIASQKSGATASLAQLQDSLQQLMAAATNDATWNKLVLTDATQKADQVAGQQLTDLQVQANDGMAGATNEKNLFALTAEARLAQAGQMVTELHAILNSISPDIDKIIKDTEANIGSLMWSAMLRPVHTFIDVVSFVSNFFGPLGVAVGRILDVANGLLYFTEGKPLLGMVSIISALPVGKLFKSAENASEAGTKLFGTAAKNADNALALGIRGSGPLSILRCTIAKAFGKPGCFVTGTPVVVGEGFELAAGDDAPEQPQDSWDYVVMATILLVAAWRFWEQEQRRRKQALAEAREELFATVDADDLWRDPLLGLQNADIEVDRDLDPSALETCRGQSDSWHEEF